LRPFDAIVCTGSDIETQWVALKLRALLGRRIPVIHTFEGLVGSMFSDRWEREYTEAAGHPVHCHKIPERLLRRLEQSWKMADHIIAISPFLARLATIHCGNKVSVLPLGVDTVLFQRTSFARAARPRVIGVGTVGARKRPQLFVSLAEKFAQADFMWFGDGDMREAIVAEIQQKGLRNLQFPGTLEPGRLARELAKSDILVLPSFAEGVPKVTQEAAAAGLAQIIFGFYEAPTVVDGSNGFVVWSDAELFDRLSQLLSDRDLTETMGRAGRRMAEAWSWDIVAPKWEAQIIAVCSRSSIH